MEKFLLGTKKEMSQLFRDDGTVVPVTVISAGPCEVTQVRTKDRDGYDAVQLGFGEAKKPNKPLQGHLKQLPAFRHLREFRVADASQWQRGQELRADTFTVGERVRVTAISKGKGFQGVVRRHGFAGSPATHGHKDQHRMPGSIGATDAQRVFKGTRMAGHMGATRVSVRSLEVIKVDPQTNTLLLKGAVPGSRNGLVIVIANQTESSPS